MFEKEYTLLPLMNQYLSDLSDDEIDKIIDGISRERLTAYLSATADEREALALYQINAELSKHIHELIGGFEVALRNQVSNSIAHHYGRQDWYRCRAFVMQLVPQRRQNIREVRQRLRMDRRDERTGRVTAGLTFHFWVAMHENKYRDIIWTPHLHKIWPKSENLRRVHKDLLKIRDLRNRIAHHEPIFTERWHNRVDAIWERFSQISPDKHSWYQARLNEKIELLKVTCESQI